MRTYIFPFCFLSFTNQMLKGVILYLHVVLFTLESLKTSLCSCIVCGFLYFPYSSLNLCLRLTEPDPWADLYCTFICRVGSPADPVVLTGNGKGKSSERSSVPQREDLGSLSPPPSENTHKKRSVSTALASSWIPVSLLLLFFSHTGDVSLFPVLHLSAAQ